MAGAWRVRGGCVAGAWRVRGGCVAGAWRVRGGCVAGAWRVRYLLDGGIASPVASRGRSEGSA